MTPRSTSPLEDLIPPVEEAVKRLPREAIPALIGDLERIKAAAMARLLGHASRGPAPDEYLSVAEAAELLNVKERWLYQHADRIPGCRRLSQKCVRFSRRQLVEWFEGESA